MQILLWVKMSNPFRYFKTSPEIIRLAVLIYIRFPLSLRNERKDLRQELLKRNVGVFGAINLRTDGERAVVAFRKESGSPKNRWFFYELERNEDGVFSSVLKGH